MRPLSEYVKEILAECPGAPVVIVEGGVVADILNLQPGRVIFVVDTDEDAVIADDRTIVTRYSGTDDQGTEQVVHHKICVEDKRPIDHINTTIRVTEEDPS